MGRRRSIFSQRSINAFKKQSPESKIASGIFLIVLAIIGLIIGIILLNKNDLSIIGLPIIFPSALCLIVAIVSMCIGKAQKKENEEYEQLLIKANMSTIDRMDGKTFEKYIAALYKLKGFTAELTKASGDYGVDVILHSPSGSKIIIQTKCYSNKVSISAVQEISAARSYYGTNNAWVITNNYFTQPAINLARSNGIKLMDRKALAELINSTEGCTQISESEIAVSKTPKPTNTLHKATLPKESKPINNLIALNDYNNWYSEKLFNLKNEIIALYGKFDYEGVSAKIIDAESVERKSDKNYISLHFFYQDIIGIVYALRAQYERAIDDCLKLCDKDIEILKLTNLQNSTVYALSRKAIIFEKQGKFQEAIEVCDYGIANNFLDNGKPFIIRKERLLKKI